MIRPVRGWLVDTNVVSEIRKGPRADRRVMAWADRVPRVGLYLSRLTVAEIRVGIGRVTDPGFQAELDAWLRDGLLPWFADRLLEVDEAVLIRWRTLAFEAKRDNYTNGQRHRLSPRFRWPRKYDSLFSDLTIPWTCLLYTSPSPRDGLLSRMPSSA